MKPNIVLIILDAVRAENLPFYGYHRNTMPYLNSIIDDFVVYKNNFSTNNWTVPVVASLFTSTYLSRHGFAFDGDKLPKKYAILPQYLKAQGYDRILLSSHPYISSFTGFDRGFNKLFNKEPLNGHSIYESFYRGISQKIKNLLRKKDHSTHVKSKSNGSRASALTNLNSFLRWYLTYFSARDSSFKIDAFKKALNRKNISKPYFATFHFFETHTPYIFPNHYRTKYVDYGKITRPLWKVPQGVVFPENLTEEDFYVNHCLYDGGLNYMDYSLSHLIKHLKNGGDWDNTMVIIMGDHGENLGNHGLMFHKFVLYDTLIKVPLLIKYPGSIKSDSNQISQNTDIFPTIYDILGSNVPFLEDQFMGRSLISENFSNRDPNIAISELLKPWQKPPRYDEIPEPLKKYWNRFIVSVRTKNAKYIHSSNGDSEYYDILNDPSEEKNIIQTLSEPQLKYFTDMAKPYFDELTKQYQKNKNRIISPQDNLDLDPEVVNALKALGYVR